jgi:photosystem II stability/assembly factor-like uncharacterized protein
MYARSGADEASMPRWTAHLHVHALTRVLACAALGALATVAASPAASSNVVVTTDIASATVVDASGCAPDQPGITAFGTVQPGTTVLTSTDCDVSFGSTNDTASLRLAQADGTATAMSHPTTIWTRAVGVSARMRRVRSVGGTTLALNTGGYVVRSTDGGQTWPYTSPYLFANATRLSMPSSSVAWAVGTSAIRISSNVSAPTPAWGAPIANMPGITVNDLAATSATSAWAFGNGGAIRRTTNAGATAWTTVASGVTWNINGADVLDSDSLVAWGPDGHVLVTSDATTWRDISLPTSYSVSAATIIDDDHVFAVSNDRIWSTANATSASPTWVPHYAGRRTGVLDIRFANANVGVGVGNNGFTTRTTDGGATWTPSDAGTWDSLESVAWDSAASTFVAVGAGVSAHRSTDSGGSWSSSLAGLTSWADVATSTDGRAWRVGSDGLVQRSTDAGTSWSAQTSGTTSDLTSIAAWDSDHLVAVGRDGAVVTTADGGASWTVRSSPTGTDLFDVGVRSGGRAWAVGYDGVIVHSADYGATWTSQASGTVNDLSKVLAFDSGPVVVLGDIGTALRTTDSGANWSSAVLPTGTWSVMNADVLDRTDRAIYSANGSFAGTTDAGATWTMLAPAGTYSNKDLVYVDESTIVAVSDGSIRWSRDGGATWPQMTGNQMTYHWLNSVAAFDRDRFLAVGDGDVAGFTGSSDPVNDYAIGTSDWDDGPEAFGACLRTTTAIATWTANATCDQSTDGSHWHAIPAATGPLSEVARTTFGAGVRTVGLRFGLRVAASRPPGTLSAPLTFLVVAPAA